MKPKTENYNIPEIAEKFGISEDDVRKMILKMNICPDCQYENKPTDKPCPVCGCTDN